VAAIVLRAGAAADTAAILAALEGRVARFKHPRHVVFVHALPKNAMGKVQKRDLAVHLKNRLWPTGEPV
jgi:malonyl-CoA/methylmalonyl-CoA synthetase